MKNNLMRHLLPSLSGCLLLLSPGCFSRTAANKGGPAQVQAPTIPEDSFVTLKDPLDAHAELCAKDGAHPNFPNDADMLTRVFCQDTAPGGSMPQPTGLNDLLKLLNLDFKDPNGGNGTGGNPAFAMLSHSSALTARKVSSIMPTVFLFTPPPADGSVPKNFAFLAYDPGEQFAEVAVDDPTGGSINFYLVMFQQACNLQPGGCVASDLVTQKITTGWSNIRIYEMSTALGNTIFDCHVCHDPQNTGNPILRMQELEAPFTHWFSTQTEGGKALFSDFHAAHPANEDYGPLPAAMVDKSDPALMAQMIVQDGFGQQPNPFPSAEIEAQIKAMAPGQPAVNVPAGASTMWENIYDNAVAGQFIATPYHDVKITDPDKLSSMTAQYRAWVAGTQSTLPDIREVFLDAGLRDIGFAPKLGGDGKTLLAQMCQECHNANLDPGVSRDNFRVDQLSMMSRAEKDLAIARLKLGTDTRLVMPPPLFRTITDDEKQSMITELQQ
jgi:hypothetical protein